MSTNSTVSFWFLLRLDSIHTLLAYPFRSRTSSLRSDIRTIVRKNDGEEVRINREKTKVEFFEPALVITDMGAQERDDNKQLKYVITPPAILRFVQNNRRWFKEPDGGGDLEFDNEEKVEPPAPRWSDPLIPPPAPPAARVLSEASAGAAVLVGDESTQQAVGGAVQVKRHFYRRLDTCKARCYRPHLRRLL